jgi:hypothetical protein
MIELAPEAKEHMNYDTAWLYCATLTRNNHYDWRLPTNKEYNESPLIMNWYEDRYHILGLGLGDGRDLHVTPVRTKDD